MNLFLISLFVFLITLALQHVRGGNLFDFITPLLVSIGLVATKRTAVLWTLCMAFFWSATTRHSFTMIVVLWGLAIWTIRILSRDIEWRKPIIIFLMAMLFSFAWQISVLMLVWFNGNAPTLDTVAILSLIFRPLTSGIIAAIFWTVFFRLVNPHHHLLRED